MSVSDMNLPSLSHSEPKYTHFISPESSSNLFPGGGNLGSFGNKMMLEEPSFHSVCLLSLFLWFRLADMDICAVEVRGEGLEDVGFCVFPQMEKELGYEEH